MTGDRPDGDVFTLLVVCTGNMCRSPLAERLGRAYLAEELGDDAEQIRLISAGTRAVVGAQMHPHSSVVLHGLGGDPNGFAAQQLSERLVAAADVVLTMTRAQRAAVLELSPRALPRAFTLREAADRAADLRDVAVDGDALADRARALVSRMAAARAGRDSGADDVPDPIDGPIGAHQRAAELIADTLIPVLERLVALRSQARR